MANVLQSHLMANGKSMANGKMPMANQYKSSNFLAKLATRSITL